MTQKAMWDTDKKQNLTKRKLKTLKKLYKKEKAILTNTDKEGPVNIMDTEKYTIEAKCQFSHITSYKKATDCPTLAHKSL